MLYLTQCMYINAWSGLPLVQAQVSVPIYWYYIAKFVLAVVNFYYCMCVCVCVCVCVCMHTLQCIGNFYINLYIASLVNLHSKYQQG